MVRPCDRWLFLVMAALLSSACAADYAPWPAPITNVTNSTAVDRSPDVNANGWVTWAGVNGTQTDIYRWDGATKINVSNSSGLSDSFPRINATGQIVWEGFDGGDDEIYFWNGTTKAAVTSNTRDDAQPRLNASGFNAWYGWDGSDFEIYRKGATGPINTSNNTRDDTSPEINSSGHIVWYGYDGNDYEVYLWNGTVPTNISNRNLMGDTNPDINDLGRIVWQGHVGSDYEIIYWDGSAQTIVTDNTTEDHYPQINNSGIVVWQGSDGTQWDIYRWDGSTVTNLTNSADMSDMYPRIDDNGWVTWEAYDGTRSQVCAASPSGTVYQLTNSATWHSTKPRICNGYITWYTQSGGGNDIFRTDVRDLVTDWPAPTVTAITPDNGPRTGPIAITDLAGTNFHEAATIRLTKAGENDIFATDVVVVSEAKITCTFDLTAATVAAWDVVVQNTDLDKGALPGGFTVTTPDPTSPEIVSWGSSVRHGATVGEIIIVASEPAFGGVVESRGPGVGKLVLTFTEALNPATVNTSAVSVTGRSGGDLASYISSVALTGTGDTMVIEFSPALPDVDVYAFLISTTVTDVVGNHLTGERNGIINALQGDATGDKRVNTADLYRVQANLNKAVTVATARNDVTGDGRINTADLYRVQANLNHSVP